MKIVFFINTLSSGGAEHQMSYLASFMCEYDHDVTIVTYGDLPDHYDLDSRIKRIRIAPEKNKFIKFLSIIKYFITLKADVVISFCQQNNMLVIPGLLFNSGIRLIVGERNYTIGGLTKIERILFNYLYRRAEYIVPNSHAQANHIIENSEQLKDKVRVITNYTDITLFRDSIKNIVSTQKRICVFARYAPQKNYERFAFCVSSARSFAQLK